MVRAVMIFLTGFMLNCPEAASQQHFRAVPDTAYKKISLKPLPQNFYKESLGFFCKKELQVQKLVKLPVYFRLGTRQYTDYLDRKPDSRIKSF